ncbi:hypothetical protein [Microcystis phage Mel-JY01]
MIKLFIFFVVFLPTTIFSQSEPVLILDKKDLLKLVNKIQAIEDSLNLKSEIIKSQNSILKIHEQRSELLMKQIDKQQQIIETIELQNTMLQKQIQDMTPKWYEDKTVWYLGGVVSTIVFIQLIK